MAEPGAVARLDGRDVLVCGVGMAGTSAARALLGAGARVLLSALSEGPSVAGLVRDGARWAGPLTSLPAGIEVVVVSPGMPPRDPLLAQAAQRGVAVWGEAELAWRLRGPGAPPWLALTGTNGKTTTVHMLEAMLRAAGLHAVAVGNVGVPVIDAVLASDPYDVLAVELSSQQLHYAPSLVPAAGAILNLAPDHLDWHGSMRAYEAAKIAVWGGPVAIGNADDRRVGTLLAAAAAPTRVACTLATPGYGQLGLVGGRLISRAFGDRSLDLIGQDEVRPSGRHNVANALVAAALARSFGVAAQAIAAGLRDFVPDPHRNEFVLTRAGVVFVDDSKATNPHAAQASLTAYERVVWIAGGQLKGVAVDELLAQTASRIAGAVLLGQDRDVLGAALARHAPDVPVIVVDSTDDGAMTEVVRAAAALARAGDTVLLAPGAASYDMFANYAARGDAFAAAVRALGTAE